MRHESLPVVIIGAGPVGLAAAAHALSRNLTPLVLETGSSVGAGIRRWGHVRMFSPWKFNVDAAASDVLVTLTATNGLLTLGSLAGLSLAQQYGAGDLNGDGANDYDDFRIFQTDFDAAHGAGALERALAGVPEPGALGLAVAALIAMAVRRSRR